jgi:diguanylate cyclase (GGDEF)-like protein
MEKNHSSMLTIMGEHQIMVLILFAATVIAFLFVIFLLVRPLRRFVNCIREGKPLEVRGAYECRSLAYTYNAMCEQNIVNENRLRYQAEHDALTGLLNRGAFDRLQQFLKTKSGSLGLLIIDVDKFKQVNDGYGHEMGDKVLKKVAEFLKESFRSTDYPARIGGDEFAVILSDVTPEQKNIIAEKIREMNRLLTHPSDDLPVVSLSVGGAFSDNGFSDQLYKKADLALYDVKEHGRCGCRFYEEKGDGE